MWFAGWVRRVLCRVAEFVPGKEREWEVAVEAWMVDLGFREGCFLAR